MKTPNGKSAAMIWKDHIVVKLHGDSLAEAMKLDGIKQFEPMAGRPMKDWVQIPFTYKDKWKKFVMSSSESIGTLKKK
jgi:hypothetical protein